MKRNSADTFIERDDSDVEDRPLIGASELMETETNSATHRVVPPTQSHKRKVWLILTLAFLAGLIADRLIISLAIDEDPKSPTTTQSQKKEPKSSIQKNPKKDETVDDSSEISCQWSPDNKTECFKVLSTRLPFQREKSKPGSKRVGQRWLFFGDSTMMRLARRTALGKYLFKNAPWRIENTCGDKYSFRHEVAKRCHYNKVFDIPYRRNKEWSAPDYLHNGEGPASFGAENPYCTDCAGCQTEFVVSTDNHPDKPCTDTDEPLTYGGYFGVEFARDVEMQSPEYQTTQENVASFLSRTYNTEEIVESWGKPVCVVCFGHHDAAIPNITRAMFRKNAMWYLELFEPQCEHIIFLANTAPLTEKYPQKFNETREWNHLVRDILATTPKFRPKSTFFDPFEASAVREHADNVHMNEDWYRTLGKFFLSVIRQ